MTVRIGRRRPRMAPERAGTPERRTGSRAGSSSLCPSESADRGEKVVFNHRDGHGQEFPPRNDDQVQSPRARPRRRIALAAAEDVADPALRAIARDRSAEAPRRNDAESIAFSIVGTAQHRHVFRRHTPPLILHRRKLCAGTQAVGGSEPERQILRRADRQPLATLGPAPFQDRATVLGPHPYEETVRAPAAAAIGLERALHWTPGWGVATPGETCIVTNR